MSTQGRGGRSSAPYAPELLPASEPISFLRPDGTLVENPSSTYTVPGLDDLLEMYRRMVIGRRFDAQCTALTKQGRLAVYPSSRGQEACQIGAVMAIGEHDWMFPTYRESMAMAMRGLDPVEGLTLLRGNQHCGYNPITTRTAAQTTPLATQMIHAAGVAYGEQRRGTTNVALAFIGDGATSEGDFHEGLNYAAVFNTPTIFFVQNNGWAITVPLSRQTAAPALSYKGIGYGIASEQVDGNDPLAVLAVTRHAVERARRGEGPFLIEAHTYRMEAHTNADDDKRYRSADVVEEWAGRDPLARLETYLTAKRKLTKKKIADIAAEAEDFAASLRDRMNEDPELDPMGMFDHPFVTLPPHLQEQKDMLAAEIAAETEGAHL